jgi:hypothetical protein
MATTNKSAPLRTPGILETSDHRSNCKDSAHN